MEIRVKRDQLFKSVSRVQSIIEKRSNMPILSTILLSAKGKDLYVSATDLEIGFQEFMPADIIKEGSVTISGRKLFEILKEGKSTEFTIREKENNWVYLSDGVARFELASLPAEEFPAFVEPEDIVMLEIEGDTLRGMIDKTIYSVTVEEAGFKLSGVFTEKVVHDEHNFLRMVATDGHRLSMVDSKLPEVESLDLGNGVMIPKKGMMELNKLSSEGGLITIGFKDKNCVVKRHNVLLVMRLLDSKFPDYQAVIPQKEKYCVKVNRVSLLEAMRKMLILSSDRYRAVKITLENNVMQLVSTNPDLGEAEEDMKIDYQDERIEAGFNPRYFVDVLQSMQSEIVELNFIDGSKPCVLRGEVDEGFLGLIMPMRL